MNIQAAATQLENGIRAAFVAEKIGAHLIKVVRGPRTLTACLKLYEPDVKTLIRVGRTGQSIEARAGVSPIRIHSHAGVVYVEAPSPEAVTVYANSMEGDGLLVPLGMTPMKAIAGVDFEDDSHLICVAPTNGGKTTALLAIVWQLARQHAPSQARFIISTFKPVDLLSRSIDWQRISRLSHVGGLIVDVEETVQMIKWLEETMYQRTAKHITSPRILVVLDDLLNLLSRAPELAKILADIASLSRGAGIHLLIGTQRLGSKGTGDSVVSGNITGRVVFKTVNAQDAEGFTGRSQTGAHTLGKHPGDAILVTKAGGVQRIAVGLVTDDDLTGLPQSEGTRPWLATGTGVVRTPARTGTATGTGGGIPVVEVENVQNGAVGTGTLVRFPLADRQPTRSEMMALAALYQRTLWRGKPTKNGTLRKAYGKEKTPQTKAWLDMALAEMGVPT